MIRYKVAVGLVLLAAVSAASAGSGGAPSYKTPQEAFAALEKASKNKDWKTVYDVFTDETQEFLAGALPLLVISAKEVAKLAPKDKREEALARLKKAEQVLARNGLTEEFLKRLEKELREGKLEMKKAFKMLLAPVKDRRAFVVDMLATMDRFKEFKFKEFRGGNQLKDVKVEGDKATAVLVNRTGKKEWRRPIAFRRLGGGWRMELPEVLLVQGSRENSSASARPR
jgi:hypothetical protein